MSHYYEIKIRFNGTDFHTSMQTAEGEQFRFVADAAWPALCTTINTDSLLAIETQRLQYAALELQVTASADALSALKTEYAAFKLSKATVAESVRAIIADTTKSDAQSCAEIDALAAYELTNKRQRDRAAAIKARDDAQAEVDKYEN